MNFGRREEILNEENDEIDSTKGNDPSDSDDSSPKEPGVKMETDSLPEDASSALNSAQSGKNSQEEEENDFFEEIDFSQSGVYKVREFDENTVKYRWKAENFFHQKKNSFRSPQFNVKNHPFNLLVFPNGNDCENISIYIEVSDFKQGEHKGIKEPRFISFQICLLNLKDVKRTNIKNEAEKRFYKTDADWGFRNFCALETVKNPQNGFYNEAEDFLIFEVTVHSITEAHLLNPINYSSKKETSFVGLKNQGATCYMNSLLQTWFHISFLRKALYKMPIPVLTEGQQTAALASASTDTGASSNNKLSIPLALQRVFFFLQNENGAVDTKELTRSFGWNTMDSFLQHDVQELLRVLTDNLEKKMEKTAVEGTMKKLFEGKLKSYIKCINVNFESAKEETFYDLQLGVKGCKNIQDSLEEYIHEETLSGDNKYMADGHGLQDAKKGAKFLRFPPVLTFHLKRFDYDVMRDINYKINDRFEFGNELDVSSYLSDDSPQKGEDLKYSLFSVLVHSGDVSGGHYYAFIRPFSKNLPSYKKAIANEKEGNGEKKENENNAETSPAAVVPYSEMQWFKFDDEKVYKVKACDAIENNFGGDKKRDKTNKYFWQASHHGHHPEGLSFTGNFGFGGQRYANAYMLVYIRNTDIPNILKPIEQADVPRHLIETVEKEKNAEEQLKREISEAHQFIHIFVATKKDLENHEGYDLTNTKKLILPPFKVRKTETIDSSRIKFEIFSKTGIIPQRQRFWTMEKRQNKTVRPDSPIDENSPIFQVFELSTKPTQAQYNVEKPHYTEKFILLEESEAPQTEEETSIMKKVGENWATFDRLVQENENLTEEIRKAYLEANSEENNEYDDTNVENENNNTANEQNAALDGQNWTSEQKERKTKIESEHKVFLEKQTELEKQVKAMFGEGHTRKKYFKKIEKDDRFVFIKFYDPEKRKLSFKGTCFVNFNDTFGKILPSFLKVCGVPEVENGEKENSSVYCCYEEVSKEYFELKDPKKTLAEYQIYSGDIFIVQKVLSKEETQKYEYPDVSSFFKFLTYRVKLSFVNIEDFKESYEIEMLLCDTYRDVIRKLHAFLIKKREELKQQPEKLQNIVEDEEKPTEKTNFVTLKTWKGLPQFLRLTPQHPYGAEVEPQRFHWGHQTENTLSYFTNFGKCSVEKMFFEYLPVPIDQLDSKDEYIVTFFDHTVSCTHKYKLILPKNSTSNFVLSTFVEMIGVDSKNLRIVEVKDHRIHILFRGNEKLESNRNTGIEYRVEIVPEDETKVPEDQLWVQAVHFYRSSQGINLFENPFYIFLRPNETLSQLKERILMGKLGLKKENFADWKFCFVAKHKKEPYLKDDDIVIEELKKLKENDQEKMTFDFGMEHQDKAAAKQKKNWFDKSIFIAE